MTAMSTRRAPLSSNPNAANSPLRASGAAAAAAYAKQKRSHASMQREENYGHPPPAKKQILDAATATTRVSSSLRSPTVRRVQTAQRGVSSRVYHQADRVSSHHHHQEEIQKVSEKEAEAVRRWQQSQRLRFPKLVFYFDNLPEDQISRLSKHIAHLGAREDKFFSIDITHIVTTRSIPPEEKTSTKQQQEQRIKDASAGHVPEAHEPLQTINPSLLSRNPTESGLNTSLPVKRRLFETATTRRMPLTPFGAEDAIRKPKLTRSTDILQRARDMGMKIWSLDKLQRVLDALLEPNPYRSAELGQRTRSTTSHATGSRVAGDQVLLQLLDKERYSGPSDRDPTVATRELIYFKGPYLYVYDIEERQRPIMVREYTKVADKEEGDWPQLRPSGGSRCPFIEDTDQLEMRAEKRRARMRMTAAAAKENASAAAGTSTSTAGAAANATASASLQKTLASRYAAAAAAKSAPRKRTLAEMQDGQNRHGAAGAGDMYGSTATVLSTGSVSSSAVSAAPVAGAGTVPKATAMDFQNAFTSRAKSARCFAGEPVASGLQAAGITSAIRSQMISSATGTLGARAGTSKEIHGLQRKVLQKSTASTSQQDLSSRRFAELNMEQQAQVQHAQQNQQTQQAQQAQQAQPAQQAQKSQQNSYSRSTSVSRSTAAHVSAKVHVGHDDGASNVEEKPKRAPVTATAVHVPRQKKRDPKPGYCENCQDKFDDFEDHILSHKHRKFAEDDRNWTDLDDLLKQLTRCPKYGFDEWQ